MAEAFYAFRIATQSSYICTRSRIVTMTCCAPSHVREEKRWTCALPRCATRYQLKYRVNARSYLLRPNISEVKRGGVPLCICSMARQASPSLPLTTSLWSGSTEQSERRLHRIGTESHRSKTKPFARLSHGESRAVPCNESLGMLTIADTAA